MQKINFQDLPNTTTPVNADNLNELQENVENSIDSIVPFSEQEGLGATDDLDDYRTYGIWFFSGTPINCPCYNGWLIVLGHTSTVVKQIVLRLGSTSNNWDTWIRTYASGAWQAWKKIQVS